MSDNGKYVIDLQSHVYENLEQAEEYLRNRLDADRIVHLSLQPNCMPATDEDFEDPIVRFLHYKTSVQDIDNDVSSAAWAAYLLMHAFLDKATLRRQTWHNTKRWSTEVSDQKLICTSHPSKVRNNSRASKSDYTGDTCTSIWTPLKNHINHMLKEGLDEERPKSVELAGMLGKKEIVSVKDVKKLFYSKKNTTRFVELLEAHMSPAAKMAVDMSDTIGNMMLCPAYCNAPRAGEWGDCDNIEYFLAHVFKYFETSDVRFLNRLYAGHYVGNHMEYDKYETLEEVPSEANRCSDAFLAMLDRADVHTWDDFLDEFCFHAFTVAHDSEHRPMNMRTGRPVEWDGNAHYRTSCDNIETDNKMFLNLSDAIINRNAEIFEKLR